MRFRNHSPLRRFLRDLAGAAKQLSAQIAAEPRNGADPEVLLPNLRVSKIALVKLDAIGDFVLCTGFFNALREFLPAQNVTLFCCAPIGALARHQYPDWTIVELGSRDQVSRAAKQRSSLHKKLASSETFDILIDLRSLRSITDSVISSWIPANLKVGVANTQQAKMLRFWRESRVFDSLLNSVNVESSVRTCQELNNYQRLFSYLTKAAHVTADVIPTISVSATERSANARTLSTQFGIDTTSGFLLVSPGSRERIKEYPTHKLASVIENVSKQKNMTVLITGSSEDSRTTDPLFELLKQKIPVHNLTGSFELVQHLALVSSASAVLTMDSSTAHIAGALKIPAVVLIGGGYPNVFGPWGTSSSFRWLENRVSCFGCSWQCIQPRPICIEDIPVTLIQDNLLGILEE